MLFKLIHLFHKPEETLDSQITGISLTLSYYIPHCPIPHVFTVAVLGECPMIYPSPFPSQATTPGLKGSLGPQRGPPEKGFWSSSRKMVHSLGRDRPLSLQVWPGTSQHEKCPKVSFCSSCPSTSLREKSLGPGSGVCSS